MKNMKKMPDDYWRKKLNNEQYRIMREKGTEAPFTGKLLNNKKDGFYTCVACGTPLFSSETKYESGTGWPSFSDVLESENVELTQDNSFGMKRIEVKCANCGSHLGHLFDDGPTPEGKRYCINSCSLDFKKK